jgi:hypothetical protein
MPCHVLDRASEEVEPMWAGLPPRQAMETSINLGNGGIGRREKLVESDPLREPRLVEHVTERPFYPAIAKTTVLTRNLKRSELKKSSVKSKRKISSPGKNYGFSCSMCPPCRYMKRVNLGRYIVMNPVILFYRLHFMEELPFMIQWDG